MNDFERNTGPASGQMAPCRSVYLDGFSTTALCREAKNAMLDAWSLPGNPASPHGLGERAADLIDTARRNVADLAGCAPSELTFTSGATEANNIAILGGARAAIARSSGRRRIVLSAIEHRSVFEPAREIVELGFELMVAPVDGNGRVDLECLRDMVDRNCWMVSVMAVNNETGVIQPVPEVAAIARAAGALAHCDAAQAFGKMTVDLNGWEVDFASISGHKVCGPAGIGALFCAAGTPTPEPLQYGGGQQGGLRPGTEPAALIAGFGAAALAANSKLAPRADRRRALAEHLLDALRAGQVEFEIASGEASTVAGGLSLKIQGVDAEDLCTRLARSVYLSTGSACSSMQLTSSHVLRAMGLSVEESESVIRLFLSHDLTEDDINFAVEKMIGAIKNSR